jgi:hypothetical protein
MNEIVALNSEIRSEVGDRFTGDKALMIPANRSDRAITQLSKELRSHIEDLVEQIVQEMPPEFGFELFLGDSEPYLAIRFDDGPGAMGVTGLTPLPWLSVAEQLRGFDWDGARGMALSGAALFNSIVEQSPNEPENVPPTVRLQAKFKTQTHAFHKTPLDPDALHVLQWQEIVGLHQETFPSKEKFVRTLPDLMTCGYQVVAVVMNGKPVSARQIDRMKRAALNELKDMPISYAKASGRLFPPTILEDQP